MGIQAAEISAILKDQIKKEHATELFYQKEVPITNLTKDSNAKYLAYVKRSDV